MTRFGTLLFLYLVVGTYFLSATPAAFGWSGSTGGDDSPSEERPQTEALQSGDSRDTLKKRAPSADIEPGDIFQPRTPSPEIDGVPGESERIEPGDNFMPRQRR